MGWFFSRKPPHPLAAGELRAIAGRIASGEIKAAAGEVRRAREELGDLPAVRYLECLLYHEGSGAAPAELLAHLSPALTPADGARFPEARLLEARLQGALGRFDAAAATLNGLGRDKLPAALAEAVRTLAAELGRVSGGEGARRNAAEAEAKAADLARLDLVIRWRLSDLARLDALLDDRQEQDPGQRRRLAALIGEIAVRAAAGTWRLALRPEDQAVVLSGREWSPARALHARLNDGTPLYGALHAAIGTPRRPALGLPEVEMVIEPLVHPAVVADHAARMLLTRGVSALAVFRERPTAEGTVVMPVSFVDKGGVLRAAYIETRPWEPERVGELRRWIGRLRQSVAREASCLLLAAYDPPPVVRDLIAGREGAPGAGAGDSESSRAALAHTATPRSLDQPKLVWLEQKAEMMEGLVRAALGGTTATDIELIRKLQQTVIASFRGDPADYPPKQWHALYGYGALYGRALGRSFGGRWTSLGDDKPPAEWEMLLPWGQVVQPIGRVLALAHKGLGAGDLVAHFLELKTAADTTR